MIEKRPKLRLRKQVIISIPILLFIIMLSTFLLLNKNKTFKNEVSPYEVAATSSSEMEGIRLSELEPIANLSTQLETRRKDNTVIYYASLYNLHVDVALEVVHRFTKNYTDPLYLQTNVIGDINIINKNGSFTSFEAGVVYFVRDFYSYPERYGKNIAEARITEYPNPEIKNVSSDGQIYMNNGLTFEQYVGKISQLFGLDPSLALAICYQESGIKTSGLFKISNNIGGHRSYNGWMSFPTLESGIIYHVLTIKGLYTRFNINPEDPNNIAVLSGVYVNGTYGSVADHWLGKVLYFQEDINSKELFTIK